MRKSVLLTLIAMLALAMGFGPVASAANGGNTGASAKKGKGCKKNGKGKKSAATSAKKKGKGCKSKGNKGSKGKGPVPSNLPLTDGTYDGQEGVGLIVLSGGTGAKLKYAGGLDGKTCVPIPIEVDANTVKSTSTSFTASAESPGSLKLKWMITVTPDLRYTLTLDSSFEVPGTNPCNKPGAVFRGTLAKQG